MFRIILKKYDMKKHPELSYTNGASTKPPGLAHPACPSKFQKLLMMLFNFSKRLVLKTPPLMP